jgi:uncharacterized protein (DUF1499 family)
MLADPWVERPAAELAEALTGAIASLSRSRVVRSESEPDLYLHAEFRSLIFRFVDDVELHRPLGSPEIAVRSASRVGGSDMGVNPRRVEALRELFVERGIVRP